MNLFLCLIASCAWNWKNSTKNSGISQIKALIKDIETFENASELFSGSVFIAKTIGTICTASILISVGKEGPMVYLGSAIMDLVFRKVFQTSVLDIDVSDYKVLIANGAAAGYAVTFGSPLGCTLYADEEFNYHNKPYQIRLNFVTSLLSCVISLLFSKVWCTDHVFLPFGTMNLSYTKYDLIPFFILGIFGGLFGAVFNSLYIKLLKLRKSWSSETKIVENFLLVLLYSVATFSFGIIFKSCKPKNENTQEFLSCGCENGYYNEATNLLLVDSGSIVNNLLHHQFKFNILIFYLIFYILLFVTTNGASYSAGLLIPSLIPGTVFGQIIANLMSKLNLGIKPDFRTYVLIGASASSCGIIRQTISLIIILNETIRTMSLVIPMSIAVFTSKIIADLFNQSIFEMIILVQ